MKLVIMERYVIKKLKGIKNGAALSGYLRVNLRANNQSYTRYHRLVALNF